MVAVPVSIPVTMPVVPTEATVVLPLLQEPPDVASLRVVVPPLSHAIAVPLIVAGVPGKGLTVTTVVAERLPQLFVYV